MNSNQEREERQSNINLFSELIVKAATNNSAFYSAKQNQALHTDQNTQEIPILHHYIS